MSELASMKATVSGRVQGVFFRAFVSEHANRLGLKGYVSNLPGGKAVEVVAEGNKSQIEKLIDYLKAGTPSARVERLEVSWAGYTGKYSHFNIRY